MGWDRMELEFLAGTGSLAGTFLSFRPSQARSSIFRIYCGYLYIFFCLLVTNDLQIATKNISSASKYSIASSYLEFEDSSYN